MIDEHRRIYDEDKDIPNWLKWLFVTINRVGFPIVAFIMMWYLCSISIAKVVVSVDQNTSVLSQVQATISRIDLKLDR